MKPNRPGPVTRPSLLIKIRDKDNSSAWKEFVDTYSPLILRYCGRWQLSRADADDVLQEVLRCVVKSIRSFEYDPERGLFRDWLHTVTRNEIHRHWKRRAGNQGGLTADDGVRPVEEAQAKAEAYWNDDFLARILERAMERTQPHFDPESWKAFLRVWRDNVPPKTVAEDLGKTRSWVDKAKFRVKERLVAEVVFLSHDEALTV
jgi:RNA polymerase sigma-70 factor (ECF subfamily)